MSDFKPNYTINKVAVMVQGEYGPAYTEQEWDTGTPADYELEKNGSWTFQGKPFSGEVERVASEKVDLRALNILGRLADSRMIQNPIRRIEDSLSNLDYDLDDLGGHPLSKEYLNIRNQMSKIKAQLENLQAEKGKVDKKVKKLLKKHKPFGFGLH